MTTLEDLDRFKFAGVVVPYQWIRVRGGLRDHVHQYPHSPGGAPEKFGRKLYEVNVRIKGISSSLDPDNVAWPSGYAALRQMWERGDTKPLHLPSIGEIQAYAVDWDQTLKAGFTNGEDFELHFREDGSSAFVRATARTTGSATITARAAALQDESLNVTPRSSIFDTISNAANELFAVLDTADMYAGLVESKILGLVQILDDADRYVKELGDPQNHRTLDALHALWESAIDLKEDVDRLAFRLTNWTVPMEMPISAVAIRLYNDASRAEDLLHLNGLEDPYAIKPGTKIRYYEEAA